MKFVQPKRSRARAVLHATPVAAAVATLLCSTAYAQAQPAAETITITGIRRGIESAIATKKNADGVVEAISAEDIGKLPDTTIAESLARLPGVTTQRTRLGEASNISIRGLGPDFNGYLLNGREQTSTGDSRAVDLSVYPAELIGSATIYKTGDAGLMTAGLAGTIDTRLVDPLAFPGRVLAGNVEQTKTSVGLPVTGKGNRYSLAYIDQFADRTIGLAIGFVHSDGTSNSLANGSWGNNASVTTTAGITSTLNIPFGGGLGFESDRNKDKRDGFAAILSYKPNKNFNTEVDFYSAKINTALKKVKVNAGTNNGAVTNATVSGGVVQSGTFQLAPGGVVAYSENIFDDDKIESLGWKSTLKFGDGWTGSLDFNHNSAKRVEKDIEAYGGITTADTLTFDATGSIPQFKFGNPGAYTDPTKIAIRDQAGWSGVTYPDGPYKGLTVPQAGYSKGPVLTDKIDGVRFDLRHDLPEGTMFTDIQFGANYTKRSKDRVTDEGLIISANNGGYDRIPYPGDAYVATNVGGTGLNVLTFDPQQGLWAGAALLRKYNDDILSKTWSVYEKVTTAYAKANIDTTLAGIPVSGNVGVQIVGTDQSSAGYRAQVDSNVTLTNPAGALRTDGKKYTDFLPSLNLKGDLGGGHIVRLGLSEQIARATLTDLRNSFAANVDTKLGIFVGSAGNPQLKPFKATALDLAYEKYFGNKAYVGVAGFYKKLDTYITQTTNIAYDFTAYAKQLGLTIPPAGAVGVFTSPTNASGGNVSGLELTASIPFNLMTSVLEGFGFTASYSSTASSVKQPNLIGLNPAQQVNYTQGNIPLPNLSKTNTKLMLYYERAGFSAFVATNSRSEYIGSVANATTGGYPTLKYITAQTWVSAQVGYEFQEGFLKGLGFRFEGNNLNKPTYRELRGDRSVDFENKTGAFYAFKLSYKLQ